MSKQESELLNLCMQDQLFCSMYGALCYMHQHHGLPVPTTVWVESLAAMHEICSAVRPDMMADIRLADADTCMLGTILFMLTTQDMKHSAEQSDLKDVVCEKLNGCELWPVFYEQMRLSEDKEERRGRYVGETDFSARMVPGIDASQTDAVLVTEFVNTTLAMNDGDYSRKMAYVLRRIDDQHGGIYHNEIMRLEGKADDSGGKTNNLLEKIAGQYENMNKSMKAVAERPTHYYAEGAKHYDHSRTLSIEGEATGKGQKLLEGE